MSNTPTAAEQHQSLTIQEQNLLAALGQLLSHVETTKAALATTRAALQGAEVGFKIAQEAVEKSSTAEAAPEQE